MKNVTIARLNTLVTANASQFTREMDKASAVAKTRGGSINDALSKIGVGISIGAIAGFSKSVLDLAGNIQDLAMQANLTPRGLQTISNIAMDSGVAMEDVARASEKMRSKLQDAAANGADPLNKSLRKIGLSAEGLAALNMEEKWQVLAVRLTQAKDQQEAMNIASDIFGEKIGPKLRETLQRLSGGFNAAARSASGLTLSNDQLAKLDDAGDRLGKLGKMVKVLGANMLTGESFQKDYAAIRAGLGLPEQVDKNVEALNAPVKGLKTPTLNEKMLKAQAAAQEKSFKEYWEKVNAIEDRYKRERALKEADPFYQMEQRKKRDEFRDKVGEIYTTGIPELSAFARDLQRGPMENGLSPMPTDQFSKIGLMSAVPRDNQMMGEQKQQTEHLKQIEAILKLINQSLRSGTVASNTPKAIFAN